MDRFLVPAGDVRALAERVASFIDWRTREPELANECVDWVTEHFPYETHLDGLEEIFERFARR
jgi:glycosyltransferase involved in cell wall biosynthesis